jgi:hypothetical protein
MVVRQKMAAQQLEQADVFIRHVVDVNKKNCRMLRPCNTYLPAVGVFSQE